jgi:hypothetical protein
MYNTEEIRLEALKAIEDNNLLFIGDIPAYVGFSKRTIYDHKLHECNDIKSALNKKGSPSVLSMTISCTNVTT